VSNTVRVRRTRCLAEWHDGSNGVVSVWASLQEQVSDVRCQLERTEVELHAASKLTSSLHIALGVEARRATESHRLVVDAREEHATACQSIDVDWATWEQVAHQRTHDGHRHLVILVARISHGIGRDFDSPVGVDLSSQISANSPHAGALEGFVSQVGISETQRCESQAH